MESLLRPELWGTGTRLGFLIRDIRISTIRVESDPIKGMEKKAVSYIVGIILNQYKLFWNAIVQNVLCTLCCPHPSTSNHRGENFHHPLTRQISVVHLLLKQKYSRVLEKQSWARETRLRSWKLISSGKCIVECIIVLMTDNSWNENELEERDKPWSGETSAGLSKEVIFNKEMNEMREQTMPYMATDGSSIRDIKCKAPETGTKLDVFEKREEGIVEEGQWSRQRWAHFTKLFSHL